MKFSINHLVYLLLPALVMGQAEEAAPDAKEGVSASSAKKCPYGQVWVPYPNGYGGKCCAIPPPPPPKKCPYGEVWVPNPNGYGGKCVPIKPPKPVCLAPKFQNLMNARYDEKTKVFTLTDGSTFSAAKLPNPNRVFCDGEAITDDFIAHRLNVRTHLEDGCKVVCEVYCG